LPLVRLDWNALLKAADSELGQEAFTSVW